MIIEITKLDHTHHFVRCVRPDGTATEARLETKTFLAHDFLHFAVESAAGLRESFWGRLASGRDFAERVEYDEPEGMPPDPLRCAKLEIGVTEMLVGSLTSLTKDPSAMPPLEYLRENLYGLHRIPFPEWLHDGFIADVKERLRRLFGEWRALPYGRTMRLTWSVGLKV
jgi:hypothetical protein